MRRPFLLAAIAILAIVPVVAANTLVATAPIAVSTTAASPLGATSCTNEDLAVQQSHSTLFLNSELEPFAATNPGNLADLVGAYQQDRWNDGGSRGIVSAFSANGGSTWTQTTVAVTPEQPTCTAGGCPVDYYGTMTPLRQMSTINAPEPRLLTVQPYDKTSIKNIERAIRGSVEQGLLTKPLPLERIYYRTTLKT